MALTPFRPDAMRKNLGGSAKITTALYVEDEDANWEVAEFALRDKYALTRASNATEAFSALRANKFDVVLMDIQLSGSDLNGIQITQILKGRYQGIAPSYTQGVTVHDAPIIFVTAYNARYRLDELMLAGGDEMIPKPVDFTRLTLAITKLVARRMSSR